jgi:protoporphyrinogen oxidase
MTTSDAQRWAVVGGGVLGMTLAHRLAQNGHRVTLIEQAESLGGLASAWRLGDVVWDRHYHVTLLSDRCTRDLLRELGLEDEMDWVQTRTCFFTDGAFHPMSSSLEFLRFPPLGMIDKIRLGATIFYASRITDWKRLERIPVEDWLRRLSGNSTFEKIWLPLLRAKLGDNYEKTSAAFIWATIARMYAARRTGLKREMFGYVRGGYSRVLDVFRQRLEEEGAYLMLGTRVRRVTSDPSNGVAVETGSGSRITFDNVVLTVAPPIAAVLCPGLPDDEKLRLQRIQYQGIVCASLLLKKPLDGYYITNITEPWVPFTAVIEMSALVDRDQLDGNSLVYLPKYLPSDDPSFEVTDEEWRETFLGALLRMYPSLSRDDVLCFRVSRERFVHALSTLSYSDGVPPRTTSMAGVYMVNSAQIVNGTLNVNETVRLAEEALPDLLARTDTGGSRAADTTAGR